jgi:CBS domain-containing protein
MLVRDLMVVGVLTCTPDTALTELARLALDHNRDTVVVLDSGNAVGVVGDEEFLKAYQRQDFRDLKAEDVMREDVPQVPPDIPLAAAAQVMLDQGISALFLMHHAGGIEYPAAQLSIRHLLRYLAASDDEQLSDLGIHADRRLPLEAFIERRDAARRLATRRKG